MTVAGIIEQYNAERPNQVDDSTKLVWLKKLEKMIINEVIISHKHDLEDTTGLTLKVSGSTLHITSAGTLTEHINGFDMDTELLVPEPYDDIYIYFLDQRIALQNNDKTRFNVATQMYNNALLTYQQYFNRTYPTIRKPQRTFRHEWL